MATKSSTPKEAALTVIYPELPANEKEAAKILALGDDDTLRERFPWDRPLSAREATTDWFTKFTYYRDLPDGQRTFGNAVLSYRGVPSNEFETTQVPGDCSSWSRPAKEFFWKERVQARKIVISRSIAAQCEEMDIEAGISMRQLVKKLQAVSHGITDAQSIDDLKFWEFKIKALAQFSDVIKLTMQSYSLLHGGKGKGKDSDFLDGPSTGGSQINQYVINIPSVLASKRVTKPVIELDKQ